MTTLGRLHNVRIVEIVLENAAVLVFDNEILDERCCSTDPRAICTRRHVVGMPGGFVVFPAIRRETEYIKINFEIA